MQDIEEIFSTACITQELSSEELKWIDSIRRSDKELEKLSIDKKSQEYLYVRRYNKFMKLMLGYHNLRTDFEYGKVYKRLIKLHKIIQTKELDKMGIDYVILDGLYVVADIMFIDINKFREFYKHPTPDRAAELFPEGINANMVRPISFKTGLEAAAVVCDKNISRYLYYNKDWDYSVF